MWFRLIDKEELAEVERQNNEIFPLGIYKQGRTLVKEPITPNSWRLIDSPSSDMRVLRPFIVRLVDYRTTKVEKKRWWGGKTISTERTDEIEKIEMKLVWAPTPSEIFNPFFTDRLYSSISILGFDEFVESASENLKRRWTIGDKSIDINEDLLLSIRHYSPTDRLLGNIAEYEAYAPWVVKFPRLAKMFSDPDYLRKTIPYQEGIIHE